MQWQEHKLCRADGSSFFCRTIGQGSPLLLIHGAAVDSEFFYELGPCLAEHFRVITYDRNGFGRSVRGTDPEGQSCKDYFIDQGNDAAFVLESLVPGEKAKVIGCSCGGAIAGFLAGYHPELVERVLIHEPPIYALMEDDKTGWEHIRAIHEALDKGKYTRALNRFLLFLSDSSSTADKPMTETEMDNFQTNGMTFMRYEFRHGFDRDLMVPSLPAAVHPAILRGLDSAGMPLSECALRVSKLLSCPLHEVRGGHNAAREIPEEFAQDVLPLLQSR